MHELSLPALDGANPLAFFCGLGVLAASTRMCADGSPRLSWTDAVTSTPLLHAPVSEDDLVALVLADRDRWFGSPVLEHPRDEPAGDVKFEADALRRWIARCAEAAPQDHGRALGLVTALVAEGSLTDGGEAKPTDLHFTAGQQQFLRMARTLRDSVAEDHVREALWGPWRYESALPSFKWDVTDDRIYALAAVNPAGEKKHTIPGAEWLALLGLTFFPVGRRKRRTVTTGCAGSWKQGTFSWPLWEDPLTASEVRTLLGLRDLVEEQPPRSLVERGVLRVHRAIITRSDQGGYGSFRPPRAVLDRAAVGS